MTKKFLLVLMSILIAGVMAGCRKKDSTPSVSEQSGKKVIFAMKYRGFSGKKDDLMPQSYYVCPQIPDCDSAFIDTVKEKVGGNLQLFRSSALKPCAPEFFAVEHQDTIAVALYYDLDADGQLDDNEKIQPCEGAHGQSDKQQIFLTPDFVVTNFDGKKIPFRFVMRVPSGSSQKSYASCAAMGSFEATAQLNGKEMRLMLLSYLSGPGYAEFGNGLYALVPASQNRADWIQRRLFSSMIFHDERFYNVRVKGSDEVGQSLEVHLIENTNPRGKIALKIHGNAGLKMELGAMTIGGKRIYLDLPKGENELPAGQYKLNDASFEYGLDKPQEMMTSFYLGKEVTIEGGKTTTIDLGKPTIVISAREAAKRNRRDEKSKTEFAEGTDIAINVSFRGMSQETYRSFGCREDKKTHIHWEALTPELKIANEAGDQIASFKYEYG